MLGISNMYKNHKESSSSEDLLPYGYNQSRNESQSCSHYIPIELPLECWSTNLSYDIKSDEDKELSFSSPLLPPFTSSPHGSSLFEFFSDSKNDLDEYEEKQHTDLYSHLLPSDLLTGEFDWPEPSFSGDLHSDEGEDIVPLLEYYTSDEDEDSVATGNSVATIDDFESEYNSSANTYTSEQEEESDDPELQLVVARSTLEAWLLLRERNLLKTPDSQLLLTVFSKTVLSPVATLLVQLHAPNEWRSCECCDGFIETYCCLHSHYLQSYADIQDDESEEDYESEEVENYSDNLELVS